MISSLIAAAVAQEMEIPPTQFWPFSLASGLAVSVLAGYVWTRRSVSGAYVLFATLIAIAHLSVTGALEERSTTLAAHIFWQHVQTPGYAAIPVCCLLLTLSYVARPQRGWRVAALFVIPIAGVLIHWTNAWHHLYWSRVWIDRSAETPIMGRVYGAGFWICVAYSYLLTASSASILVRHLARDRAQRARTLVFLGAVVLPCASSLLYIFEWLPVRYLDITPYVLAITGAGIAWALFRYRFQGIVPVALRSVVDSMTDGIIVLDLDSRVADLNPAAEALLDRRKEELVGQHAGEALREFADLAPYYEGDGSLAGDVWLRSSDHGQICAASAIGVVHGNRHIGRVITLRDVTAERQASHQLREARRAAEAAAVAKSRFLANMSHEIRTPMNAVVGATELLLDSELNADQKELVETAQESAHCLLSILNDILDFSKIDAGRLELELIPFDLYRLMNQIVRVMEPVAAKKGLELKLHMAAGVPRVLIGDPTRVRQVMLNLIGNAIKFTAAGWVAIGVDQQAEEPGQTRIAFAVRDTGIGIAPDRIGTLFQEFNQADSTVTRRFGGTGLGLAISQRLVEKMGGTIRVESTLGRGTEFTVETAYRLADPRDVVESPHMSLADSETFPGCRVLLTEDNLVNQKIGQRILEKLGCQVVVANNGREAIALAEATPYDVILMDLHMPEIDGLEATRNLRLRGVHTPVVALTASVLDETRHACEAAGMNAFLAKPIRVDEIASILKRFRNGTEAGAVHPAPTTVHP